MEKGEGLDTVEGVKISFSSSFEYLSIILKKVFILFALISAYALILGHSFVPHHHHEVAQKMAHGHEHHNEHHKIDDCEQHSGLPEFFSNFSHDSYTLAERHFIGKQIEKSLINEFQFICIYLAPPWISNPDFNSDHPPGGPEFASSLFLLSARALRAPPVC